MENRKVEKACKIAERKRAICALPVVLLSLFLFFPSVGLASDARLVTWDTLVPGSGSNGVAASLPRSSISSQSSLTPHVGNVAGGAFDLLSDDVLSRDNWDAADYDVMPGVLDKRILIDGYVLPLAWEGIRVTDFLLVPWVGACIHMPSPPPNQIIHVSSPEGLVLEKQFQAVRLTGVLRSVPAEHEVFLVDGSRKIHVSYALADAREAGTPGKVLALSAADLPKLAQLQIWINALFTDSMKDIADDGSSKALILALIISFGYGALHTLGPGHGKSVVISYFVGTGGGLRRGLTMGAQIAVFHVLSAVIVVFLLDFAVRQTTGSAPSDFRAIRLGSYALIMAIGAFMLWQAVGALIARRTNYLADPAKAETQAHAHLAHSGCSACASAGSQTGGRWIAASVGVVPCTGALLVMLFGLANDLVWPAILMVVSISVGMAFAMSAIGMIALFGRRLAENRLAGRPDRVLNFDVGARLIGASCVLAIGALLFVLTLSYPPVLQAPIGEVAYQGTDRLSSGG